MLDVQNNREVLSSDRYQSRGNIDNSIAMTKKCTMGYCRSACIELAMNKLSRPFAAHRLHFWRSSAAS